MMAIMVEEAIRKIRDHAVRMQREEVPLFDCAGRVSAEDVYAAVSQPPFSRSPLDGYAVRAEDTCGASGEHPAALKVISKYYAGEEAVLPVNTGEASRIMTGSMLPSGADCVVRQEDTDEGETTVRIYKEHRKYQNYVFAGEDFQKGTLLVKKDTCLDAAAAAVLAAAGISRVKVFRRMRAAIISTGSELTAPGQPLKPGKIYDSNLYYLKARLQELGAECVDCRVTGDDRQVISRALEETSGKADLVLTTGGVSVGQKDLLPEVMEHLGAKTVFHGVKMKPGMPTMFSMMGTTAVLSLSGNPYAAAVGFEVLARPYLAACTGRKQLCMKTEKAFLKNESFKTGPSGRYARGILEGDWVTLREGQSNGQMLSMIGCNCLAHLPAGDQPLRKGHMVEVLLL